MSISVGYRQVQFPQYRQQLGDEAAVEVFSLGNPLVVGPSTLVHQLGLSPLRLVQVLAGLLMGFFQVAQKGSNLLFYRQVPVLFRGIVGLRVFGGNFPLFVFVRPKPVL